MTVYNVSNDWLTIQLQAEDERDALEIAAELGLLKSGADGSVTLRVAPVGAEGEDAP